MSGNSSDRRKVRRAQARLADRITDAVTQRIKQEPSEPHEAMATNDTTAQSPKLRGPWAQVTRVGELLVAVLGAIGLLFEALFWLGAVVLGAVFVVVAIDGIRRREFVGAIAGVSLLIVLGVVVFRPAPLKVDKA